jgi:hypothetical protein
MTSQSTEHPMSPSFGSSTPRVHLTGPAAVGRLIRFVGGATFADSAARRGP